MTVDFRTFWHPLRFEGGRETLIMRSLVARVEATKFPDGAGEFEPLNLDPDYQRGHVWTDEQAARFVGHLIEGGATPMLIVNRDPTYNRHDEVVDGKQRITACYRWYKGEIPAELTDGRLVYRRDLDETGQRYITGMTGAVQEIGYVQLDRAGILRLYLRLNRGGTVHTDEEIARVRALLAEAGG